MQVFSLFALQQMSEDEVLQAVLEAAVPPAVQEDNVRAELVFLDQDHFHTRPYHLGPICLLSNMSGTFWVSVFISVSFA